MPATIQQHNERAASVWSAGGADYEEISRGIADAIEHCVRRLDPQPGERILDLSTGTGWTSRLLPRRGATVVGTDIASGLLDTAERRAREERLPIAYRVGDAEDLPFETGAFDAVTSTFGIMFAARPEAAAAELARVCRTGGRIAITTWLSDSTLVDMFAVMKHYMPPSAAPAPPSPFEWGRTDRIRELLGGAFRCASRRACRTTGSRTPRPPGRPSRKGTARRACWPRYSTPISARPCVRTSWRFTRGLPPTLDLGAARVLAHDRRAPLNRRREILDEPIRTLLHTACARRRVCDNGYRFISGRERTRDDISGSEAAAPRVGPELAK